VANEGIENLIPQSERTKEEQREIARLGGIASGEARRAKRDRKQMASDMLELMMQGAGVEKIKKFFGIDGEINAYQTMFLSCVMKAMQKGDANALEKLLKISGEQFAEVLDVTVGKSEKLADIMEQLKGE
jgi:hypothetical protein